jgi:AraC-like DNA-binding protein
MQSHLSDLDPAVRLFWEGTTTSNWSDPRRRIYDCELVYVSAGEFWIDLNGRRETLRTGDLVIVPPNFVHESSVSPGGSVVRHCIHFVWNRRDLVREAPFWTVVEERFQPSLECPVEPAAARWLPLLSRLQQHREFLPVIELCLREMRLDHAAGELLLWPIVKFLLADRTKKSAAEDSRRLGAMVDIKRHIDTHFKRAIGYPELCKLSGLSRSHLCTVFKRLAGAPPMEYLTGVRLHQAQRLLSDPGKRMSVKAACYAVGMSDTNYFTRLFKKKFGVSPSALAAREERYGKLPGIEALNAARSRRTRAD